MAVSSRGGQKIPDSVQKERRRIDRSYVGEKNLVQLPLERKLGGAVQLDGMVPGSFRKHKKLAAVAEDKWIGQVVRLFEYANGLTETAISLQLYHREMSLGGCSGYFFHKQPIPAVFFHHERISELGPAGRWN